MLRLIAVSIPLYFASSASVGGPVAIPPADTPTQLHSYAVAAVAPDQAASAAACDHLRANGPAGLDALISEHQDVLAKGAADPRWTRVTAAIDRVAAQKDAYASRLYWYTDIEQAKVAARASGKPILSLHMAGRLDRGAGATSSSYLRNSLYADPKVSALLRQRFVLHWENEPPTASVTLDFGAGQKLEQPVTDNSVHWVLDAGGRPVDAIPGFAGAGAFRRELSEDADLERSLRGLTTSERAARLSKHHAIKRAIEADELPAFLVDAAPAAQAPTTN